MFASGPGNGHGDMIFGWDLAATWEAGILEPKPRREQSQKTIFLASQIPPTSS